MTTISPDEAEIPSDALEFCSKSDYWMLRNNQVYNSDYGMVLNFDINSLSVGQSVGLSVTPNGKLSFYVDGKFNDIVWRGLPTGIKYWGVADVYGPVLSIKSSFIFCKYIYIYIYIYTHYVCLCMYVCMYYYYAYYYYYYYY